MGEVLGIGLSHYPPFSGLDNDMAGIMRRILDDPAIPAEEKNPANWTDLAREEWGDDQGLTAAARHRAALVAAFDEVRSAIDDFHPDVLGERGLSRTPNVAWLTVGTQI